MAVVPASSVLGESTHDRISPDGPMLRKPELEEVLIFLNTTPESTESFADIFASRTSSWSLCSYSYNYRPKPNSKAPKVALIGCEGRGSEVVSTCRAEGQSKLLLILRKTRCVWFGFEMTPSTETEDRTVLLQ